MSENNFSEWQQVMDREIVRDARRLRVRVDYCSSDGTQPSPHLAEFDYLAEIFQAEAETDSQAETKNLRVELLRSVSNVFFTRFNVNLAAFGRRHSDDELEAMIEKQNDKNQADLETEAQFRRRELKNSKLMYGDNYVRSGSGFQPILKLREARRSAGRIPLQVLFEDLQAGKDGRWPELTIYRITKLLKLKADASGRRSKVWAPLKGLPTYETNAAGKRKSVCGIYGAQLARDAARLLGPNFEPEKVEVSSDRILRW